MGEGEDKKKDVRGKSLAIVLGDIDAEKTYLRTTGTG